MSLSNLVYVSVATEEMSDDELQVLLKYARINNERQNITGLLLYRDGFFVQALEGDENKIDALFAKIKVDRRHCRVTLLYKRPITHRAFPDWRMGFSRMPEKALEQLDGYSDFLREPTADFFTQNPSYAQTLLQNFKTDYLFSYSALGTDE